MNGEGGAFYAVLLPVEGKFLACGNSIKGGVSSDSEEARFPKGQEAGLWRATTKTVSIGCTTL